MTELKGKTALITGASSGIGAALATMLAERGVHLALAGRNMDRLEGVAQAARANGVEARTYTADFARLDDPAQLGEAVLRDLPDLDIAIHSAGILHVARIDVTETGKFDELFRVNVLAPYTLTRSLLPAILRRKGDIVFINSRAGITTKMESVPYSATKHALRSFAEGLRAELHKQGVRVFSVYPGRVATPMQEYLHTVRAQEYHPETWTSPEAVAQAVVSALQMPPGVELADVVVRSQNDTPL